MKLSEVVEQLEGFQLFEIVTQITYFLTMYLFQIYFSLFYVHIRMLIFSTIYLKYKISFNVSGIMQISFVEN